MGGGGIEKYTMDRKILRSTLFCRIDEVAREIGEIIVQDKVEADTKIITLFSMIP